MRGMRRTSPLISPPLTTGESSPNRALEASELSRPNSSPPQPDATPPKPSAAPRRLADLPTRRSAQCSNTESSNTQRAATSWRQGAAVPCVSSRTAVQHQPKQTNVSPLPRRSSPQSLSKPLLEKRSNATNAGHCARRTNSSVNESRTRDASRNPGTTTDSIPDMILDEVDDFESEDDVSGPSGQQVSHGGCDEPPDALAAARRARASARSHRELLLNHLKRYASVAVDIETLRRRSRLLHEYPPPSDTAHNKKKVVPPNSTPPPAAADYKTRVVIAQNAPVSARRAQREALARLLSKRSPPEITVRVSPAESPPDVRQYSTTTTTYLPR